jgi:hypothetical protein
MGNMSAYNASMLGVYNATQMYGGYNAPNMYGGYNANMFGGFGAFGF